MTRRLFINSLQLRAWFSRVFFHPDHLTRKVGPCVRRFFASYGQTVIKTLPFKITQPGKYILQSDLNAFTPGHIVAIDVQASDVDIDLNGFSLLGLGIVFSTGIQVGVGVSVHGVVIHNGTISNFTEGIIMAAASAGSIENVQLTNNIGLASIDFDNCSSTIIRNCQIVKTAAAIQPANYGIKIKGGSGNQVTNTSISGLDSDPYADGIRSTDSSGNYFANDYINNCSTAMFLSATDKYRAITTTNCPDGIKGGIDVDGKSD